MDFLNITKDNINIDAINKLVADNSCGAISLFVGTTRDTFNDKKVVSLEYEAYEPMALKEMKKICNELRQSWPDLVNIAIYHRVGLVPVGENSVIIAISSPHRKSSLSAISNAIDRLKATVPIWKKEKYEDDRAAWKENIEYATLRKRPRIDFSKCQIEEKDDISSEMVQINAEENEIQRRIHCFAEKKRDQINLNNIWDYTEKKYPPGHTQNEIEVEEFLTCARANIAAFKQEGSKCHLKVRRVKNQAGPQIKALDKLMSTEIEDTKNFNLPMSIKKETNLPNTKSYGLPVGLKERIVNIEQHLKIQPIYDQNIFDRIKAMENKIMFLESISPEYKHFLPEKLSEINEQNVFPSMAFAKKTYTAAEIDEIVESLIQRNNLCDTEDVKPNINTDGSAQMRTS